MSKEAIEHYEAALKEAFPSGATGNVFHHWNEARKALAEQPAPPPECQTEAEKTAFAFGWFKALETVREQPAQQEPVAWMYQCSADSSGPVLMQNKRDWAESSSGLWTETPLYTSLPAQRKPLTDDEIQECWYKTQGDAELFARAIEAKLKEKNT